LEDVHIFSWDIVLLLFSSIFLTWHLLWKVKEKMILTPIRTVRKTLFRTANGCQYYHNSGERSSSTLTTWDL
jgi:hypothetical protein